MKTLPVNVVRVRSMSEPLLPPKINALIRGLSYIWLLPKREYLRRFRIGRVVLEHVAGIDIVVLPSVYNPVVFRAGEYFAKLLSEMRLPGITATGDSPATALDMGSGTGVIAIVAASRGYRVDAVDLNDEAVRCTRINAEINLVDGDLTAYHGNLFEPVMGNTYDLITFSPPSFRGVPSSKFDLCWRSQDIFERFARDLPGMLKRDGVALVLQTSHGDEAGLLQALESCGLHIEVVARKHFGVEILSLYGLTHPTKVY